MVEWVWWWWWWCFRKFLIIIEKMHYPDGVYIAIKLSKVTENAIKDYQQKYLRGQKLNEDLHCTLIYSQKPHKDEVESASYKAIGTFDEFSLFGPALVVVINSDDLVSRNNVLVDEHKFISEFDEYTPHITLCYDSTDLDINSLPPIDFEMVFEDEYVEALDTEWVGSTTEL